MWTEAVRYAIRQIIKTKMSSVGNDILIIILHLFTMKKTSIYMVLDKDYKYKGACLMVVT